MKLDLRISDRMSEKNSPLGSIENKLIRIPEELRQTLGLETGRFLYLKTNDGGTIPLQVSKAYLQDAEEGNHAFVSSEVYHQLYTETKQRVVPTEDVLLGCDPEFFIVDRDSKNNVSASNFFPQNGQVGSDCGLGELRPLPSSSPDGLVVNVAALLKNAQDAIDNRKLFKKKDVYMVASSVWDKAAAGFHVHFGLPSEALTEDDIITEALRHRMVTVLDYYVGILSIIPEGSKDSMRRAHMAGQYGKPGDFRYDYLTFEYRVPGGHLLRHPILTRGLFAICKLVMTDMLGRVKLASDSFRDIKLLKDYTAMRLLYPKLPDRSVVYNTITSAEITGALSFVKSITEDFMAMQGYDDVKDAVTEYLNYLIIAADGHQFSEDIAKNWRLTNEGQPKQMAIHQPPHKACSFTC